MKKIITTTAALLFLTSVNFALAQGIVESLGKSSSSLGFIFGMFIGLPFMINSIWIFSKEKESGPTEFFSSDFIKYFVPIIAIIFVIGAILNVDVGGEFLSGLFGGMFIFIFIAIVMYLVMSRVKGYGEAAESGVLKKYGLEKKGEEIGKEERTEKEYKKSLKKAKAEFEDSIKIFEDAIKALQKATSSEKNDKRKDAQEKLDKTRSLLHELKLLKIDAEEYLSKKDMKEVEDYIKKAEKKLEELKEKIQ